MNPLTNAIPARYRKYTYAVGFVGTLAYGAYQASAGDWSTAIPSFVGSLITALAASNTPASDGD